MRNMDIKLVQIQTDEFDSLFSVVKQALYTHVDAVFGWSDEFQRKRLKDDYEPNWFYWVYQRGQRIGVLCFKPYDNALHVHLLVVFPEFQNQKLGEKVMKYVHHQACLQGCGSITLSSFVRNESAVRFYKSLGYRVIDSDENFYSLSLQVSS
ncbi:MULTISPECIES: GNAT family N-acetyltransferase [Vibrio]|nr:GNAT family N-acetyltransferase [Vibrio diazotrophicus]PNH82445.1 N-acetyltransferase [Vibrio diazotrophicus]